jgi:hypothetical protein
VLTSAIVPRLPRRPAHRLRSQGRPGRRGAPARRRQDAEAGKVQLDGDQSVLATFAGLLDEFDLNFNIVTP